MKLRCIVVLLKFNLINLVKQDSLSKFLPFIKEIPTKSLGVANTSIFMMSELRVLFQDKASIA